MRAEDFIVEGRLPDIECRTEAPEEVVCPRITRRDGVAMLYLHNERDADHKGFVPAAEFLRRLAKQESGLACTGYRANGKQTTISFNKRDRVAVATAAGVAVDAGRASRWQECSGRGVPCQPDTALHP